MDETRSTLLSLIRSAQIDKEGLLAGEESSSKSSMSAESGVETMGRDELDAKLLSSSLLARKFVEWMVSTDNIQEVLDLIR